MTPTAGKLRARKVRPGKLDERVELPYELGYRGLVVTIGRVVYEIDADDLRRAVGRGGKAGQL